MKRGILIIDDEQRQLRLIKRTVKQEDLVVHEASSVKEGIQKLDEYPEIQVIILDLDLKAGGTGLAFLKQIKDRVTQYRVIVLTAREDMLKEQRAGELNVFYYLPKVALLLHPLRFAVEQAFKDIERESLQKRIQCLLEIQEKINSNRRLSDILNLICESLLEVVGGYTCHLRLFDLRKGEFVLAAFKGPFLGFETALAKTKTIGEFYSGRVAELKEPKKFDDLQNHNPFKNAKEKLLKSGMVNEEARKYLDTVQSAYIVPISTGIFNTETDAVLNISSNTKYFFSSEEERKLVHEFVTLAALAITKNWQRAKRVEVHRDYKGISQMLAEVSKELHGREILDNIYDVVTRWISDIVNPEMISIFLFNEKTNQLENVAEVRGNKRVKDVNEVYPPGVSLTGWVYAHGKAIRRPNLEQRIKLSPTEDGRYDSKYGEEYLDNIPSGRVQHYLCVPMKIGKIKVGVIRLINKKSEHYHKGDVANNRLCLLTRGFSQDCEIILKIAASHLAVSIRNAELVNKLSQRIDQWQTLTQVSQMISSNSDIGNNELLSLIVRKTAEVMHAEICMLFLKDEQGNTISLRECHPRIPTIKNAVYKLGVGKTGKAAQKGISFLEGKAEYKHEGKYDSQIIAYLREKGGHQKDIESFMAVPIIAEDKNIIRDKKIIGVLKVINKTRGDLQFDEYDFSIFQTFASQIGVALAIAEKNEALSLVVGGVYHEISNTSGLIPSNIDVIKKKLGALESDSDKQAIVEILDLLKETANQAIDFSKDLLGFRATDRTQVDINEAIKTAINQILPSLKAYQRYDEITLTPKFSDEHIVCDIYKTPFIHIIRNVIVNAYQAMEKHGYGNLTIKTDVISAGQVARIEFIDNGIGIKRKDMPKIFNPNFSGKEGGNGLGLWMVRLFLGRMDGVITARSRGYGRGATFSIRIPTVEAQSNKNDTL